MDRADVIIFGGGLVGLALASALDSSGISVILVDPADPDRILYAARNRLHLSTDGGRFWRSLAPELPDVEAVAWAED